MAMLRSFDAWQPNDYGRALDLEVQARAIAAQVATVVTTNAAEMHFPVWSQDPSAAWTAEGAEIATSDATTGELIVRPSKVAALTRASNEMLADSHPSVAEALARALARDTAKKIDAAFFGDSVTNGPDGIKSLTTASVSYDGPDNLDFLVDAVYEGLANGANISHVVLGTELAKAVDQLKLADASNQYLVGQNPQLAQAGQSAISGLIVLRSTDLEPTEGYALDRDQVQYVLRQGTTVAADQSA